ncbi:MAG: hypothetical protein JO157_11155 [Acetobacteraceae bacterium]|nr:hypothetical protein [Acetobacteraceae bacterium]
MLRTVLAAAALALAASPALAQGDKPANSIQGQYDASRDPGRFDLDHDGTLDLAEAKSAAAYEFNKLDTDHDGTLSRRELGGRVGGVAFKRVNLDKDHTLDKAEYLKLVEQRFDAAGGGPDKTIKIEDLPSSGAGKRLLQLMQ